MKQIKTGWLPAGAPSFPTRPPKPLGRRGKERVGISNEGARTTYLASSVTVAEGLLSFPSRSTAVTA